MNIITMSSIPWDETNSIGNTFSNWFGGLAWKEDHFMHVYLRKSLPNNTICSTYYSISVLDMLIPFKSNNIGKKFCGIYKENSGVITQENKLIKLLHRFPLESVYLITDILYRSKRWLNKRFKDAILSFNPDIIFVCATDVSFVYPFLSYIKNNTSAKIIAYFPDDMFGRFEKTRRFGKKLIDDMKNIIELSDKILCASENLKVYYQSKFNGKFATIYKGCYINEYIDKSIQLPLKMIYAGSLFYGRDGVLLEVASKINEINIAEKSSKIELEIYSGDAVEEVFVKKINECKGCSFKGRKNYAEIVEIQNNSDFVILVESFNESDKVWTKYSFSTKIPDSLQSCCNILAVGPKDVSTISFLSSLDFTYIADDLDSIKQTLDNILLNLDSLGQKRYEAYKFAKNKFELNTTRNLLHSNFLNMLGKN